MEKQRVRVQPLRVCTPKGTVDDAIQIAGHSLLWNVVCERSRSI
jgi:hypothetical protein